MGRDTWAMRQRLPLQPSGHMVKLITRQGLTLETQLEIQAPSSPLQWVGMGIIAAL